MSPPRRRRADGASRPLLLLALAAAAGLLLAAVGLLEPGGRRGAPPEGAAATVNGSVIAADDYARLLAAVAEDRGAALSKKEKRRILDRLIEEELLVQRGLELGLARVDRRVRSALVSAVIEAVAADAERAAPGEEQLRELYETERDFFASPGRLRVRQVFFRVPGPEVEPSVRERAREARRRLLAGQPFREVRSALGDAEIVSLPDAPLPPAKLQEYVGPTATRAALELRTGSVSEPIRSGSGLHVLSVVEREPPSTPPFDAIAEQVQREWLRRAGDRALRAYLDDLRARAEIAVAPH